MTTENDEIELEQIIELLDKKYYLHEIDYQDNLDDRLDVIAECIRKQDWQPLDELIFEWFIDDFFAEDYAFRELNKAPQSVFDVEEDEAESWIEQFRDEIHERILERDQSNPLNALLRNTSDPVMFYDTGEEINFDVPFGTEEDMKDCLKQIKKALKIKLSNTTYDSRLKIMIEQGYSGRLVIYFNADLNHMMSIGDNNIVTFSNPMVAIINTYHGSGDHTELKGHKFSIPMNIENFFMDKEIKYSYTYEVCGMSRDWCDCTGISFSKKKSNGANKSNIHDEVSMEKKYIETFKSGKCTFGDMDMRRHRNTYYLNEYPCGTHCPQCKTFWVD
jgi:hypothetical protein